MVRTGSKRVSHVAARHVWQQIARVKHPLVGHNDGVRATREQLQGERHGAATEQRRRRRPLLPLGALLLTDCSAFPG
jgi:hypothetical protein